METETIIQRLAFAKYLIQKGNQEAQNSEPLSSVAILNYHDALELTFDLILEDKGINSDNLSFMGYFNEINNWLINNGKNEISLKPSLKKLKDRRVNIKHKGIFPSRNDIRESEFTVKAIFDELCMSVYDLDSKDISLISLVENIKVKNYLSDAINQFPDNEKDSIVNLSLAFGFLLKDYESSKINIYGSSPFNFGSNFGGYNSIHENDSMDDFINDVQFSIESIEETIKILAFGFDYKKYVKFSLLIPEPSWIPNGEPKVHVNKNMKIDTTDLEFCVNFIIECAFKLQEFDFEVSQDRDQYGLGKSIFEY